MNPAPKSYTDFIPVSPMLKEAREVGLERFSLEEVLELLRHDETKNVIQEHLAKIGEFTQADRVYVFMNHLAEDGKEMLCSQIYEWCREGIKPEIDNPDLQSVPYTVCNPRWYVEFVKGNTINGQVCDFPQSERDILDPQGVLSLMAVPIMTESVFWGFIGFDAVHEIRHWTSAEEKLLYLIARDLGLRVSLTILEQRLRESRETFHRFVDVLPMGVLFLNAQNQYTYRNRFFLSTYGWDEATVPDLDAWFATVYPPALAARLRPVFDADLKALGPAAYHTYTQPVSVRCRNGDERMTEFRLCRVDADTVAVILTDLSDRVKLARIRLQLEEQKRRNQSQQVASLERMVDSVAHFFDEQLRSVMEDLNGLHPLIDQSSVMGEDFRLALTAARRAMEVNASMLTYLGENLPPTEPVDILALCRQEMERYPHTLPEGIQLEVHIAEGKARVQMNAGQFRRILTEMLQNAQEAMISGVLRVTAQRKAAADFVPQGMVFLPMDWTPPEDGFVEIRISDAGVGLSHDDLYRIFQPFFTTKFQGRGMGLSMSRGCIKAWKGAIGAESTPGKGSAFTIYLPLIP